VSAGLVGSATARAVHGYSFGADCVLLTDAPLPDQPAASPAPDDGPATKNLPSLRDGRTAPESTVHGGEGTGQHAESILPRPVARTPSGDETDPADILGRVCRPATLRPEHNLAGLAEIAAAGSGPLVIADADLRLALPGYLDLLDVPGDATAALLADAYQIDAPPHRLIGADGATLARVGADTAAIESSGSSQHLVSDPNRIVVGLARISAADRARAARLWHAAAHQCPEFATGSQPPAPFDVALLALVRGGMRVENRPVGYYSWSRRSVVMSGSGGTGWQQRLRTASRSGDGPFSTAAIRPLSRIVTRLSLRVNVTPNALTVISVAIGVATAVLIMTGQTWARIVAAFGLQLALIIDCSDGEVARFTRRYSTFGGWLDGIGDRVKEYLVFAALAVVAARHASSLGWLLAMIAMTIVTARHLEDQSYADRNAAARASVVSPRPLSDPSDGGTGNNTLRGPHTSSTRRRFWLKKIAHVPIAERYLILSIGLLAGFAIPTLIAAIVISGFAFCWTVGGRLLAAAGSAGRDAGRPAISRSNSGTDTGDPGRGTSADSLQPLAHQLDLGVLVRPVAGRRGPFLAGTLIVIALWIVLDGTMWLGPGQLRSLIGLVAAVVAGWLVATCWTAPTQHRLGWLTLPLIWLAEASVIIAVLGYRSDDRPWAWLVFVALATVCYRRYDLIYTVRLLGPAHRRTGLLGAGGRILLVAVLAALASWLSAADGATGRQVIGWGMLILALETLAGAVWSTVRRWKPHMHNQ
jgi:hypothetical protein